MRRRFYISLLLLLVLAFCMPAGLLAQSASGTGCAYTVKQGDTLWDLAGYYLKDPFQWSKIWEANPSVKCPDLIYPGNRLTIPGREGEEAAGPVAVTGEAQPKYEERAERGKEEPFVRMGKTIFRVPKKEEGRIITLEGPPREKAPVARKAMILASGYVSRDLDDRLRIWGSPMPGRRNFNIDDEVFVAGREDLKEGDRLLAVEYGEKVYDPATDKRLGRMVNVRGVLEVKSREGRFYRCLITFAFNAVTDGDTIISYAEPELVYEPIPKNPALSGKWGYIAASKEDMVWGNPQSAVYLDMGSRDGVKPGDTFEVRRSGGPASYPGEHYTFGPHQTYVPIGQYTLPDIMVGEVRVISVQPDTSTAVVIYSNEGISPGYRVYYKD